LCRNVKIYSNKLKVYYNYCTRKRHKELTILCCCLERATRSHPCNATAPLIAILVEALYYLANQLEEILVESCQEVITVFFQRLIERVRKSEYCRHLYRLLGNDSGIKAELKTVEKPVLQALMRRKHFQFINFDKLCCKLLKVMTMKAWYKPNLQFDSY